MDTDTAIIALQTAYASLVGIAGFLVMFFAVLAYRAGQRSGTQYGYRCGHANGWNDAVDYYRVIPREDYAEMIEQAR